MNADDLSAMQWRRMVAIYRTATEFLQLDRQLRFPMGCPVHVNRIGKYVGPGIVADSTELPPDQLAVTIENGNTWHYEVEYVSRVQ